MSLGARGRGSMTRTTLPDPVGDADDVYDIYQMPKQTSSE